jgi:hypothetical protein
MPHCAQVMDWPLTRRDHELRHGLLHKTMELQLVA